MPRFYFDVRQGDSLTRDSGGLEFGSLDEAEAQATKDAAEIGRDRLPKGHARDIAIEVRDEQGERVLTVTVSMTVRREALVLAYA